MYRDDINASINVTKPWRE